MIFDYKNYLGKIYKLSLNVIGYPARVKKSVFENQSLLACSSQYNFWEIKGNVPVKK